MYSECLARALSVLDFCSKNLSNNNNNDNNNVTSLFKPLTDAE